jgi:hypothetical protein
MAEVGLNASSLIALLLFLLAPLAAYLWKRGQRPVALVLSCLAILALWFFSQGVIHEASHALGYLVSGAPAASVSPVPYSWEDFFGRGVGSQGVTGTHWQRFIQLVAPFLVDGLLILIGNWMFHWRHSFPPFVGGVVLMFTYLRSVFDLVNNYAAGVLANSGDYQELLSGYPAPAIHACTLALILLGVLATWSEIARTRPTD